MFKRTFSSSNWHVRDDRSVQTVGIRWHIKHACQSGLVPVEGATRHVVGVVVETTEIDGGLLTYVEHVTVAGVRPPDLSFREVTPVTVNHIWCWGKELQYANQSDNRYVNKSIDQTSDASINGQMNE